MYRTNWLLLIYGFPTLVVGGLVLSALGLRLPWYVWCILFPLAASVLTLAIGRVALSRERRQGRVLAGAPASGVADHFGYALQHPNPVTRRSAAEALGFTQGEQAVELLCRALADDPRPEVRYTAAESLYQHKHYRSVQPLCRALHDPDVSVRRAAARALEQAGDERAIEPLAQALNDLDAQIQSSAVRALLHINVKQAIDILRVHLSSVGGKIPWPILLPLSEVPEAADIIAAHLENRDGSDRKDVEQELRLPRPQLFSRPREATRI